MFLDQLNLNPLVYAHHIQQQDDCEGAIQFKNKLSEIEISPDLSCIEYSWEVLGRVVSEHTARSSAVLGKGIGQNSTSDYPETRSLTQEQSPRMPA